jgi:hypothetical protein
MVRKSIALLVPQPGQKTSSHGVPASIAARIVGDHSMSQPAIAGRPHRWSDAAVNSQRRRGHDDGEWHGEWQA